MCLTVSDARSTLDLIKDESRTFRPHNWDQSDRKLSIYLIEHALHLSNDPSLDSDSLGFVAAQAIEFIQSLVSPATQLESVNQKVVVKDHFSRCLKVLFETISCMNDLGMWSSRKYRCVFLMLADPLPMGLSVVRAFILE